MAHSWGVRTLAHNDTTKGDFFLKLPVQRKDKKKIFFFLQSEPPTNEVMLVLRWLAV